MDYTGQIKRQLTHIYNRFPQKEHLSEDMLSELIADCNNKKRWTSDVYDNRYEVNASAGQVRHRLKPSKLLGSLQDCYFKLRIRDGDGRYRLTTRGAIILRNGRNDKMKACWTVDHIANQRPYDDRLVNLRWAETQLAQNLNRTMPKKRSTRMGFQTSTCINFSHFVDDGIGHEEAAEKYGVSLQQAQNACLAYKRIRSKCFGLYWRRKPPNMADLAGEEWKNLDMYQGTPLRSGYQVSNMGRLKLLDGKITLGHLKLYHISKLYRSDGTLVHVSVHIAVCYAFNGTAPSPCHTVDHLNRIKTDNRAENLRWATRTEQILNQDRFVTH